MAAAKTDKKAAKEAEIVSKLPLSEQLIAKRAELLTAQQGLGSTLQNPHRINLKRFTAGVLFVLGLLNGCPD